MASNFDFLALVLEDLHAGALEAEAIAHVGPRACAIQCRFLLERACHWLYAHDRTLSAPYEMKLGAMLHAQSFKENLPAPVFAKARAIYVLGNHAAHGAHAVPGKDALRAIEDLFHVLYWVSRIYAPDGVDVPKTRWDPTLLPRPTVTGKADSLAEVAELVARQEAQAAALAIAAERAQKAEDARADVEAELATLRAEIATLKRKNEARPDDHDYNEAATRELFVDLLLREAGWVFTEPGRDTEYQVDGQPTPTGIGYVDYVLWDTDGLPLALVETKRTRKSQDLGKEQARLYADALERRFGPRPLIYLSNGYEHVLWDDSDAPPRAVQGFHRREELAWLHHRKSQGKRANLLSVARAIVDRPYQIEAIKRVVEQFEAKRRKALLVMATGTGKTRTVIALVDLLLRAGQIKRVLFLADRSPLVTQARRAFKSALPDLGIVDLTQTKTGTGTVYLSTYQTMIRLVEDLDDEDRRFGPGFFDLVIIDEAHRSVYKRYGFLFEWFDACLVGLTATPRGEVHRDTYRLFETEQNVPLFGYELADAVADKVLVSYRGTEVPTRFMRQGVAYAELTDEDKAAYEETFYDPETDTLPPAIDSAALNRWLFNADTVDKILEVLMTHGVKPDGDTLGKTIIFARNHQHAVYIVERFDILYPHHAGQWCRVIDSHDARAQVLLDHFSKARGMPQIAVSVDMLDTGIDVPEIVNLVFFKPVMSRVKFLQMVGRGTRLCKDLFGPGRHKEYFRIFDPCGNFEWFGDPSNDRADPVATGPLERLMLNRWEMTLALGGLAAREHGADEKEAALLRRRAPADDREALMTGWRDALHAQVDGMDLRSPIVRRQRETVERHQARAVWGGGVADAAVVDPHAVETLARLPTAYGAGEPPSAKTFDLLILRLQKQLLVPGASFEADREALIAVAEGLYEKRNLPMVAVALPVIESLRDPAFWDDVTLYRLDDVRKRLRLLVQFVERRPTAPVHSDFEDVLGDVREIASDHAVYSMMGTPDQLRQYRRKVEGFVKAHENHLTIQKIRRALPLTPVDLAELEKLVMTPEGAESNERYDSISEGRSLPDFVRRMVGLDRESAKAAFGELIAQVESGGRTLDARQLRFIDLVINQLTAHGAMDPVQLYEPPFTEVSPQGLDEVFPGEVGDKVVELVQRLSVPVVERATGQQALR